MNEPKICVVANAFPVLSETFVTNQIRALEACGASVVPVALDPAEWPCQPQDEAFRTRRVLSSRISTASALSSALFGSPSHLLHAIRFVVSQKGMPRKSLFLAGAKLAKATRGCVHVHAHFCHAATATTIVAARLNGTSCSFSGHGHDVYGATAAPDLPLKLAGADFAVATCDDMADDFLAMSPTARVVTIHCGVDPARFGAGPINQPCNGRLLAVGRLVEQKGYADLIRALSLIPSGARPKTDVVGTGHLDDELKKLALTLGVLDDMDFVGAKPSQWIAEHGPFYAGYVAPFVRAPDGQRDSAPVSVKEAMAMGLPVVASAFMGLKQLVVPGTGWLVPPNDPTALAEAIQRLACLDATTRTRMGTAGREHIIANLTLEKEAETLLAEVERAAARRRT
jgi:glycosyltransferase involved in cell wall biosynthesis